MNVVNTAVCLEDLENGLKAKLADLKIGNHLKGGWGSDTVIEINEFAKELRQMHKEIKDYKAAIEKAKLQIIEVRELYSFIDLLSARLLHMKNNLPKHVPALQGSSPTVPHSLATQSDPKPELTAKKGDTHEVKCASKTAEAVGEKAVHAPKAIPKIKYITLVEYETVPKYTRGRISYEKVNVVVGELNNAINSKYVLIRKQRSKLTPLEMSKVATYKQQINQECKGLYFVVDDDLKSFSNLKLDTSTRNILTILRTLKRLKEIRGPGSLLRYCVNV